jgi:hypothetical protein
MKKELLFKFQPICWKKNEELSAPVSLHQKPLALCPSIVKIGLG